MNVKKVSDKIVLKSQNYKITFDNDDTDSYPDLSSFGVPIKQYWH